MSQVNFQIQYICFRKTSGSNMGAPNLLLAPGAIQPRYTPDYQQLLRFRPEAQWHRRMTCENTRGKRKTTTYSATARGCFTSSTEACWGIGELKSCLPPLTFLSDLLMSASVVMPTSSILASRVTGFPFLSSGTKPWNACLG